MAHCSHANPVIGSNIGAWPCGRTIPLSTEYCHHLQEPLLVNSGAPISIFEESHMNARLITLAAGFVLLAGPTIASSCQKDACSLVASGQLAGLVVAAGDTGHNHEGPPGLNPEGENARPGYGYGDSNFNHEDGPLGLNLQGENPAERPGYGGPPN
jgi:hypothetical protein